MATATTATTAPAPPPIIAVQTVIKYEIRHSANGKSHQFQWMYDYSDARHIWLKYTRLIILCRWLLFVGFVARTKFARNSWIADNLYQNFQKVVTLIRIYSKEFAVSWNHNNLFKIVEIFSFFLKCIRYGSSFHNLTTFVI